MIHCHILQHMIMGMQTVWVMGDYEQIVANDVGVDDVQGYLTYGGDVYGNATSWPLVPHWFGDGNRTVRNGGRGGSS